MPRFVSLEDKRRRAEMNLANPMRQLKPKIRRTAGVKENRQHRKMYSDKRWKELRLTVLNERPLCEICGDAATTVDHKIPHKGNWDLFLDFGNLTPMCKSCHDKKTQVERKLPRMSNKLKRFPGLSKPAQQAAQLGE